MIYFVRAAESRRIKIGFANNPKSRLPGLQTGCPEKLELLFAIPGDKGAETKMQSRFVDYRLSGEWFHPGEELVEFIFETMPVPKAIAEYVALDRDIKRLWHSALDYKLTVQSDDEFCATYVWRVILKHQLVSLVGWRRKDGHESLRTRKAYNDVFGVVWNTLPDCNHRSNLYCSSLEALLA